MRKPKRRLFMFRLFRTNQIGIVRAYNSEDACKFVLKHFNFEEAFELQPIPSRFDLHIPNFGRGR